MKSNLSYWRGTKAEIDSLQELCHNEHMQHIGTSNPRYTATTTAFTEVFKPVGEEYWVMRIPSGIVKNRSLTRKMAGHNKDIKIVKSKSNWVTEESDVI